MSEKKQSYRERMEIDEIIKFEIESGLKNIELLKLMVERF